MEFIYEKKIEYGMCDTNAFLKIPEILKMVEAGVASFFGIYHKDNLSLKRDYQALWLFTKTCFKIERLPIWDEIVVIEACRVAHESRLSCIVEVYIHPKNQKEGITAWVECLSAQIASRKLLRLQAIDFLVPVSKPCPIEFSKWNIECIEQRSLVVSSSYLDYSRHVNNAEYLRILFDGFSLEEIEKMKVSYVELHYLKEAKEKDILSIRKKTEGKNTYFQIMKDVPVLEMLMKEE
ncbi:MAG: hypothetical protein K2K48_03030 [Anaeroplasmataceae bacterium]|nr:hypothetical protein [Anaeroplasmataceae bacterium]MDE6414364.1 hypothetical protein [Anaeroplasmataceae bacterium]